MDEVVRARGMGMGITEEAMNACKMLLEMSFTRGNMDDVTVMLVHLQHFISI